MSLPAKDFSQYPDEVQFILKIEELRWEGPNKGHVYDESFISRGFPGLFLRFNYATRGIEDLPPSYRFFIHSHIRKEDFFDYLFRLENQENIVYYMDALIKNTVVV